MKVLINAFSARQGGGQTYLLNLLKFIPTDMRAEVFVLAPYSFQIPLDHENVKRIQINWPVKNPFLRALWEKVRLPRLLRELGIDILFCPGGIITTTPPPRCKTVTMFRNMIPFDLSQRQKYPLGYARVRNWILQRVMLRSMQQADLVIFISEYARKVIERFSERPLGLTQVIPHGINPNYRNIDSTTVVRPSWLPKEDYLLYVSTLDVYKAQVQVVQAFAKLKQLRVTTEKLLLIGPENPYYGKKVRDEIRLNRLDDDVLIIGTIPYSELPAVYCHALVNVFASESENCPNILLEALAAGRPVLASNRPPMPEFGGNAAVYFDPELPGELAEKLAHILENPAVMVEMSALAKQRSFLYDWHVAAQQTWRAISALHREEKR